MRRSLDVNYGCAYCGAVLEVPFDKAPIAVLVAAGGKPNVHSIRIDGVEIHRCEMVGP